MIASNLKLAWGGSLGSLTSKRKHKCQDSNDVDFIKSTNGRTPKSSRRKTLKRRFHSLTEGLSSMFSSDKKTAEFSSRVSDSNEDFKLNFSSSFDDLPYGNSTNHVHKPSTSNSEIEAPSRYKSASFSSFQPFKHQSPDTPQKNKRPKNKNTKGAPPNPPPRRHSFWTTAENRSKGISEIHQSHTVTRAPRRKQRNYYSPETSLRISSKLVGNKSDSDLEIERKQTNGFPLQFISSSSSFHTIEKTTLIILHKESGTFGFTLKGGFSPKAGGPRPLLVTHIKRGGPAEEEGSLQVGDRIVGINGCDLSHFSLMEAHTLIQQAPSAGTLTINYDVCNTESERNDGSPLVVEVARIAGKDLGLTIRSSNLTFTNGLKFQDKQKKQVIVESIRPASFADRCGALSVGDIITEIDGLVMNENTLEEARIILNRGCSSKVTLRVIPNICGLTTEDTSVTDSPSFIHRTNCGSMTLNKPFPLNEDESSKTTVRNGTLPPTGLRRTKSGSKVRETRVETFRCIFPNNTQNLGLVLRSPLKGRYPIIAALEQGSAAQRLGLLSVGDRILKVDDQCTRDLSMADVTRMMSNSSPNLVIDVECDINAANIPQSGVFHIKLSRKKCILGITVTRREETELLIAEIGKGSAAHRSGVLDIADKILAIDGLDVKLLSIDQINHLLNKSGDTISLKIKKDDLFFENAVKYTIKLHRNKGILGISAFGTEDPFEPIIIGNIIPGSLADKTGAIHVGDRLICINEISLRGKPLSEARKLLEQSKDTTTLTILRYTSNDISSRSWSDEELSPKSRFKILGNSEGGKPWEVSFPTPSPECTRKSDVDSETDWERMIADLNEISTSCELREKSIMQDRNGMTKNSPKLLHAGTSGRNRNGEFKPLQTLDSSGEGIYSVPCGTTLRCNSTTPGRFPTSSLTRVFTVVLRKDPLYDDFGFSLSDGLYEKGVYINRVRKGGPAHQSGLLMPYDRILQVNDTQTDDFDCCLAVPLIAAVEDSIFLKLSRTIGTISSPNMTTGRRFTNM